MYFKDKRKRAATDRWFSPVRWHRRGAHIRWVGKKKKNEIWRSDEWDDATLTLVCVRNKNIRPFGIEEKSSEKKNEIDCFHYFEFVECDVFNTACNTIWCFIIILRFAVDSSGGQLPARQYGPAVGRHRFPVDGWRRCSHLYIDPGDGRLDDDPHVRRVDIRQLHHRIAGHLLLEQRQERQGFWQEEGRQS